MRYWRAGIMAAILACEVALAENSNLFLPAILKLLISYPISAFVMLCNSADNSMS
jgi:hypothetical protein